MIQFQTLLVQCEDPAYDYSASRIHLGLALALDKPVIFVDPAGGTHRHWTEGGHGGREGYHRIISNVHGLAALARGKIRVLTDLTAVHNILSLYVANFR